MSADPTDSAGGSREGDGAAGGDRAGVVRPTPEQRRLPEAAEASAAVMTAAGFPKMPARALLALVVSDDGALTAAEFAEVLGASAAAVSGAVRYLQTVGFIHRVSQPGSRRDRYALPDDPWYVATLRQNPVYERLAGLSETLAESLPEGPARARARETADFYRFLTRRMPGLLEEWEAERRR